MPSYCFKDEKEQKEKERVLRRAQTKRYYKRLSVDKKNAKQRWAIHDIEVVLAHEQPDRVLSEQLGRSVKAIQEVRRIYKDKNIEEESER